MRRDRATTDGGEFDETRYVLMDYFSPAAITDETGAVTERYRFSAFGVRTILEPDFTRHGPKSECDFGVRLSGGSSLIPKADLLTTAIVIAHSYLGR